ncbi:MAG: 7,8-didemethyl-8-hydroxy-5-deazariboflavin synthase subunit CofG [Candidatus Methanoliparum thermophilum]|uniref:7,8-didemethyl-8-hydroxy-5-deazariboflavin synthase n=1 Tax=Methanoliparum thermophilum TaxID=2491083 RepID=A0A520KRY6_METT2|nr:7,8-didemethyl-8-hydroxy-5-deazariboflavin synthase subunit CofG [Candidatus Methanoliparum sp. LAM-1]RZN64550.1 MAG: 7,8-didemethyl-8-hydroxy-5-deazariboflavin synthase subunit CofG [Candidatus Methanoliparum thermophilum]BDC35851.1 7,8-didemethyl-8-hydroxy-5-deazariboflavin synthase subunit CofG [Candidatus Methanoliparum sp. LAM-1]
MKYVTFSKNVFIPVTNICRNNCLYCGFKKNINDKGAFLLSFGNVEKILKKGLKEGCIEAMFTFGEYPNEVDGFKNLLEKEGYDDFIKYVKDLCLLALDTNMLPHTNPGSISFDELDILKDVNASMGLMLEEAAMLKVHKNSPGKDPTLRIKTIKDAGMLKIPFTTGILIGIGESKEDRIRSLKIIRDLHDRYNHIQEVIIQNFIPKKGTFMEYYNSPSVEEIKEILRIARGILPDDISIQIPPNLISLNLLPELMRYGANDLGGISTVTLDYINPESRWPTEKELKYILKDFILKERLPIYPKFVKYGWYSKKVGRVIENYADKDGFKKK